MLRRVGEHLEVVSNGVFLMDTRDGRSERLLVRTALDAHPRARRLLVGGLGVGFSLVEAVGHPGLTVIDVVEIEPDLVAWHAAHLRHITAEALTDPRVRVVVADLRDHLAAVARGTTSRYDVVCLDVDNGPGWSVFEGNAELYAPAGLALVLDALEPGGELAVWSAHASQQFEALLRDRLDDVRTETVDVHLARTEPDVVYVGRKPAPAYR
ncbi:MAG TPA: spermidine synthase [Actinomycetes bacterium]|nr:spermidine synthase [Actinomycetes bacterium]